MDVKSEFFNFAIIENKHIEFKIWLTPDVMYVVSLVDISLVFC